MTGAPKQARFLQTPINIAAAGDNVLIVSSGEGGIEIWELFIWNVVAQNLEVRDSAGTLTGPLNAFPAAAGLSFPYTGAPHFYLPQGRSLVLRCQNATQVSGFVNWLVASA